MTRSRAAPAPGTTTMAAGAGGSSPEGNQQQHGDLQPGEDQQDQPQQETVMPGFRFHPTEEELIEFYLRRKVDGKRFNIDLISFLDLYRYDPWDLPGLASIGDKEWFFYVPRDRKYRNGDRPNRVTPLGYWKATGADRMVRVVAGEAGVSRSIGLKKTLVFYVGKAPKGLRSSWIMNEYRLPHADAQRYQKEISLCRVYKRPGIEDNFHLTGTTTRSSAGSKAAGTKHHTGAAHRTPATANRQQHAPMLVNGGHHPSPSSLKPYNHQATAAGVHVAAPPAMFRSTASVASLGSTTSTEEDGTSLYHLKQGPNCSNPAAAAMQPSMHASLLNMSSSAAAMAAIPIDELSRAIGSYSTGQAGANPNNNQQQPAPPSQISPLLNFPSLEKIWDWNPLLESPKVCTSFK